MQECCAVQSRGPMYVCTVYCFLSSDVIPLLYPVTTAVFDSLPVISPLLTTTEPEFVKRFRSPGIDSKESIPPDYVAQRAGTMTENECGSLDIIFLYGFSFLRLEALWRKNVHKLEVMDCPMLLTAYISDSVHFKYFEMYAKNADNSFFLNRHLTRSGIS